MVWSHRPRQRVGISRSTIRAQVAAGRWGVLSEGVFLATNGTPKREARLWAALLASGDGAVFQPQHRRGDLWVLPHCSTHRGIDSQ